MGGIKVQDFGSWVFIDGYCAPVPALTSPIAFSLPLVGGWWRRDFASFRGVTLRERVEIRKAEEAEKPRSIEAKSQTHRHRNAFQWLHLDGRVVFRHRLPGENQLTVARIRGLDENGTQHIVRFISGPRRRLLVPFGESARLMGSLVRSVSSSGRSAAQHVVGGAGVGS